MQQQRHANPAMERAKRSKRTMIAVDSGETDKDVVRLKGTMGLVSGIGLIVGTIIGSGIFVSPKGVLEGTGSVGLNLIIWTACGVLSTMGALVYAELGSAVPRSGGEHAYLFFTFHRDRHDVHGGLGRVPAFLYDWIALLVIRPTMFAGISLALGTYSVKPLYPTCDPPPAVIKLVTASAMCIIAVVNCISVKVATSVQNVCMFTKLVALAVISVGGVVVLIQGKSDVFQEPFKDSVTSPGAVATAFYNGLWAFDGWNSLNFVTEELKNPSKNLPRAIVIGIPLTTLCYVLANMGYFAVLTKTQIVESYAVAVKWGDLMLGSMAWIMPVFVAVSSFGAANGCIFASARLAYAAGREGHFPTVLGFLHVERLTPTPSILFTATIGLLLILQGDLGQMIDIFIFSAWLFYGLTTLSLLVLRYTQPDLERPYKVPLFVPILVLVACGYLIVMPIIKNPLGTGTFTLLIALVGILVYTIFVHFQKNLPGMDSFTTGVQKILLVVPSQRD